jgi:hyperosmotically inducible protein
MRRGGAMGIAVVLLAVPVWSADNSPSTERGDRAPQERTQPKESPPEAESKKKPETDPKSEPPASESKKKSEADHKSEAPSKAPEEKAKTEPPPVAVPKPEPKPEESGKKPVTSPILTVKLALMADPLLFPFEIEVEMDAHKAVLTGAVSSEDEKTKATEIAGKVEGIESVVNKLSVTPALRAAITKRQDEALTQLVKERLSKSETLKAVGFDVKADNGVISLSGKTRFQVIALEAAEAARQVPGVRAVNTAAVQITGKD